jgi:hypothetical protein
MKVFIHYEPTDAGKLRGAVEVHTLKVGLPKSWYAGPVAKVKALFIEGYDKKHGTALKAEEWRLVTGEGTVLSDDAIVERVVKAGDDLRFRVAPSLAAAPAPTPEPVDPSLLQCRNYGCNQKYREEENGPEACAHHSAPPCFNDVRKWWACCAESVAYDWTDFMAIKGCARGRHSTVDPKIKFAPSPRAAAAADGGGGGPEIKSVKAWTAANPEAATAAASAAKTFKGRPAAIRRVEDGFLRCMNKGCIDQWFDPAAGGSCLHHTGAPVFRDATKSWSCCPDVKAWDFVEFMAIKGCARGAHDPGDTSALA